MNQSKRMKIKEAAWSHEFANGKITGENVQISKKLYKDAKSFYKYTDEKLSDDTVMYTVYACSVKEPSIGNLNWGISVLEPVTVCGECNMTRGHFHNDMECDEIYVCAKGEGLLLLMNEDGICWAEKMIPGSIHHIDGHTAHRLINTSDTRLEVMCCWPSTAGHDYKRIEDHPFKTRIFKENDKIIMEEEV